MSSLGLWLRQQKNRKGSFRMTMLVGLSSRWNKRKYVLVRADLGQQRASELNGKRLFPNKYVPIICGDVKKDQNRIPFASHSALSNSLKSADKYTPKKSAPLCPRRCVACSCFERWQGKPEGPWRFRSSVEK